VQRLRLRREGARRVVQHGPGRSRDGARLAFTAVMRILIAASPGAGWTGRIATAPKPCPR
jgi:hypothetical protein